MAISIDGTNGLTTDNAALKLDGTTLAVDETNNRVGIGTSSPAYPLDVVGSTGDFQSRYGTATTKFGIYVNDSSNFVSCGSTTNDETRLITNGVDRVFIDESGRVTLPYQPMFSGYRDAGDVTATNVVVHDEILINRGSHYNSSNGRFTCPVAGAYFVSVGGHAENTNPSQVDVSKNGTVAIEEYQNGATYGVTSLTVILSCDADDYIEHRVSAGTLWGRNKSGLKMAIYLIG